MRPVVIPVQAAPTIAPSKPNVPEVVVEQARVSLPIKAAEKTVAIREPAAPTIVVVSEEPTVRPTRSGSIRESARPVSPRASAVVHLEPIDQILVRPGRSGSVREQAASIDAAAQVGSIIVDLGPILIEF